MTTQPERPHDSLGVMRAFVLCYTSLQISMEQWFSELLQTMSVMHAIWGYVAVFTITFVESLAFIGLFVPGGLIIIVSGLGISHGYLDPTLTILAAVIGAIAGDSLSYALGKRSSTAALARLIKPEHIARAEAFMQRYGSVSILAARFVGVVRAIVPFFAGMTRMPMRKFMFWNVVSAIAWAVSFIFAGVIFGNLWRVLGTWTTRAGLLTFSLIGLVALFLWGAHVLARAIDTLSPYWLAFERRHGALARRVLFWIVLTLCSALFYWCLYGVLYQAHSGSIDARVENLLLLFRDTRLATFFVGATMLGKDIFAALTILVIITLLALYQRRKYIVPFLITVVGAIATSTLFKYLIERPRSAHASYVESTFSFPSGHATIVLAIYGFLAFILVQETASWRRKIQHIAGAMILVTLVGFSRLYLGVHYTRDVLAGFLIAAFWITLGIAWTRMYSKGRTRSGKPVLRHAHALCAVLILLWTASFVALAAWYHPEITFAHVQPAPIFVPRENVRQFVNNQFVPSTQSLLGEVRGSIQMILTTPNAAHIDDALQSLGWMRSDTVSSRSLARMSAAHVRRERYTHAPVGYLFWNNTPQEVSYEQPLPERWRSRERMVLRLWRVPARTTDNEIIYVAAMHRVTRTRLGGLLYRSRLAEPSAIEELRNPLIAAAATTTLYTLTPLDELR